MKRIIMLLPFLLLFSIANAQQITIGVQPSRVELDFYVAKTYKVEFYFFNSLGEVDAIYTIEPDEECKSIVKEYPSQVLVPKGTNRTNPIKAWITFQVDYKGDKTCFISVYAKPKGASEQGGLMIRPSVAIKVAVKQPSSQSSSQDRQTSWDTKNVTDSNNTQTQTQTQIQHQTFYPEVVEQVSVPQEAKSEEKKSGFPIWIVWLAIGVAFGFIAWKVKDWIIYSYY